MVPSMAQLCGEPVSSFPRPTDRDYENNNTMWCHHSENNNALGAIHGIYAGMFLI